MMGGQQLHRSVLLDEVVEALDPVDGGFYLDATFGNGGYSRAILERADCAVMAIDRDPDAIARGQSMCTEFAGRFFLREGCFSDLVRLIRAAVPKQGQIDGAAFDLGVCSTQLDQSSRGFSFRADGPLDMRMSKSGPSAADVVMQKSETDLANILWQYGEEKASRRIAKAIGKARTEAPITTTSQLAAIIHNVMPTKRPDQIDPATRSFQALRIFVNRELDELEAGLAAAEAILRPNSMLAVVSFHSLEDRIVKRFLASRSKYAARPSRHRPLSADRPAPSFDTPHRKAITPNPDECRANARARSAKLRIARRTAANVSPQQNKQMEPGQCG